MTCNIGLHFETDMFKFKSQKMAIKQALMRYIDIFVLQIFLKEGVLKKLSRKVMQPRMFFLVR